MPTCRICNSIQSELISSQVAGAPEAAVHRCQDCGIIYLFPIMTEEEEADFYKDEFEKYMSGRSGTSWNSPEMHFWSYQREGERRLTLVRAYIQSSDDVLEIGSSTGYFLDDLRGYARSVTGVEPSRVFRQYATRRGINTVADINELDAQQYDVVLLYYVLEHLRDPVGFLSSFKKYLKPKGRVLIEVPNVEDILLGPYVIPAFKPFYWQKAHYYNYSQSTLKDILDRAGFKAVLYPEQRYDLSNHMVWMMEGKPGGAGRFMDIFTPVLESAYAEALKIHWLCDTIFAAASLKG